MSNTKSLNERRDELYDHVYESSLPWDKKDDYDFWMKIPELLNPEPNPQEQDR